LDARDISVGEFRRHPHSPHSVICVVQSCQRQKNPVLAPDAGDVKPVIRDLADVGFPALASIPPIVEPMAPAPIIAMLAMRSDALMFTSPYPAISDLIFDVS
jgi:hypothetical protein